MEVQCNGSPPELRSLSRGSLVLAVLAGWSSLFLFGSLLPFHLVKEAVRLLPDTIPDWSCLAQGFSLLCQLWPSRVLCGESGWCPLGRSEADQWGAVIWRPFICPQQRGWWYPCARTGWSFQESEPYADKRFEILRPDQSSRQTGSSTLNRAPCRMAVTPKLFQPLAENMALSHLKEGAGVGRGGSLEEMDLKLG